VLNGGWKRKPNKLTLMPRAGRLYVPLDVAFFDEQTELTDAAQLLFLQMLTRAKQLGSHGHLTRGQIERCAPRHFTALGELLTVGLITNDDEAESFCFPSWNAWNSEAETKQKAGRKGGIASGLARRAAKQREAHPKQVLEQVEKSKEEKSKEQSFAASPTPPLDPLRGFEDFWNAYPKRNGKRLGRGKCEIIWRRLSLDDRRAAWRGAKHYDAAVVSGLQLSAKDAERWLRDHLWTDWQDPATPDPTRLNGSKASGEPLWWDTDGKPVFVDPDA
jgi:hypothetical protein